MHGINGMGWGMGFSWIIGLLVLFVIVWIISGNVNRNNSPHESGKTSKQVINKLIAKDKQ